MAIRGGRKQASKSTAESLSLPDRVRYRHPAFFVDPHPKSGSWEGRVVQRSLKNLKNEADILRFGTGLFSALAFLEAEGWPWRPAPGDWTLCPEGYPRLREDAAGTGGKATIRDHALLLYDLLGGGPVSADSPVPSLPRRHRHFSDWNRWMREALPEGHGEAPSCRLLVHRLLEMGGSSGGKAPLPAAWGVGVRWDPGIEEWPEGFTTLVCASRAAMEGYFCLAARHHRENKGPECVFLGDPPPYPYAALEPVFTRLLGTVEAARDWLKSTLEEGVETLGIALAELFDRAGADNWILWPGKVLDSESVALLRKALSGQGVALTLLDRGDSPGAGRVESMHLLWLPRTASDWYLEHAAALLGEDLDGLCGIVEDLPPGSPCCGSPLLPPTPPRAEKPRREVIGGERNPSLSLPALEAAYPTTVSECRDLEETGRLPQLLLKARTLGSDRPAEGSFWEAVTLLRLGQPRAALARLEGLTLPAEYEGRTLVCRAQCYERLHASRRVAEILNRAGDLSLDPAEEEAVWLLKGQMEWLLNQDVDAARRCLGELERTTRNADVRVQALCHSATALLNNSQVEEALVFLKRAEEVAPVHPRPITRFILAHRHAMAHRKIGDFEAALAGYRQARDLAAAFGFRDLQVGSECECGNALRLLCRFQEASECYERGMEGAVGLGLDKVAEDAEFNLALCRLEGGDVLWAKGLFERCVASDDPKDNPLFAAIDHYWLGVANQQLGNFPAALESAENGVKFTSRLRDSSVRIPLLVLRGDLLLLTGQRRKLSYLCRQLEESLKPETEANDLLAAAAIRYAASARGTTVFNEGDVEAALALLPQASPYFRAFWHLMAARGNPRESERELKSAWREASEANSPYLCSRALWELAGVHALPALSSEERDWILSFLSQNGVRGPEAGLLRVLAKKEKTSPRTSPARSGGGPLSLALLDRAADGTQDTFEDVLAALEAKAGCLIRSGASPHWWGDSEGAERRAMAAAAGREGEVVIEGKTLYGALGRDGTWCGFLKSDRTSFVEEQKVFARIWTRLLPPAPAEDKGKGWGSSSLHPAFARFVITRSSVMEPVLQALQRAAVFTFPVLFLGEPGVGKEACARALHGASKRAGKRWVAFNCANLTATLASSLLFGHQKGAFTGADRSRIGFVEAAQDSTLFLDEVGELPPEVQAGLLRFLQDGTFLPLGETTPRHSNARIVAATNRDLDKAVQEGNFREDLFHRLRVIEVTIPPLRRRPEDIQPLLEYFLRQTAEEEGLPPPAIDDSLLGRLAGYSWPGNVRELQNLAKALLVASAGGSRVGCEHLPEHVRSGARDPVPGESLSARLQRAEREAIREALDEARGNLSAAARILSVSRQSLSQKMKRLGIPRT